MTGQAGHGRKGLEEPTCWGQKRPRPEEAGLHPRLWGCSEKDVVSASPAPPPSGACFGDQTLTDPPIPGEVTGTPGGHSPTFLGLCEDESAPDQPLEASTKETFSWGG